MTLFRQDFLACAVAGVVTVLPFLIAGKVTIDESHLEDLVAEYHRLHDTHQAERGCTRAAIDLWRRMMEIRHDMADAQPVTDAGIAAVLRVVPGTDAWLTWKRDRAGVASAIAPTPAMPDPVLTLAARLTDLEKHEQSDVVIDAIIDTREAIAATPAATTAGLRGKARVGAEIVKLNERGDDISLFMMSVAADLERLVGARALS